MTKLSPAYLGGFLPGQKGIGEEREFEEQKTISGEKNPRDRQKSVTNRSKAGERSGEKKNVEGEDLSKGKGLGDKYHRKKERNRSPATGLERSERMHSDVKNKRKGGR